MTLKQHLQDAQDRATQLEGVLEAIDFLDGEQRCANGLTALIRVACDMSNQLQRQLDAVNLPSVEDHNAKLTDGGDNNA